MFGFGKAAKRLPQISLEVQNLLGLLSSDPKASEDAIPALRAALKYATDHSANADPLTFGTLSRNLIQSASKQKQGAAYAYKLVALMLECREINTRDALQLAARISETVVEAINRYPANGEATAQRQQQKAAGKTGDAQSEALNFFADVMRRRLEEWGLVERPGVLLRQEALGFFWGWSDSASQQAQFKRGTPESLMAVRSVYMRMFPEADGRGESMFEESWKSLNEGHPVFMQNVMVGGKTLMSLLTNGEPDFSFFIEASVRVRSSLR